MNPKLLSLLALTALCANAPDVPPLPPPSDEQRDGWFRPWGPQRQPTDADRAAMKRAEEKRQRKNAARAALLQQSTQAAG